MTREYIASYDIGTSGVKVVLLDMDGNAAGTATAPFRLLRPRPSWAEQVPEEYWSGVCRVTRSVLEKTGIRPGSVKAIVFCTQWKAAIPVSREGKVLHNAVIWLDRRADKEAELINQRLGKPGFLREQEYWPRLMWFREQRPEIYEQAETFFEVNSWLRFRASGEKYFDLTNDFLHSPDPEIQAYYDSLADAAGLDRSKFPPMILPTDQAGVLSAEAASEMGLCPGTPLFGGCGDIPAVTIGSGCAGYGREYLYLGSSGWLGTVYPERRNSVGTLRVSLYPGREISAFGMTSIGLALNWAIDKFYHREQEELGSGIYDLINREAEAVHPGCDGLIATSWVNGEQPPLSKNAGCVYLNARSSHTRGHMILAMMEAVCRMMRWRLETYEEQTGKRPESIRSVGGGACSDPWMQAMADILGVRIEVPKNPQHAGAVGGAYCALIGLGQLRDFSEADEKISAEKVFLPREEYRDLYDRQYIIFREIYPRLRDLFDDLALMQQ